MDSDFWHSRWSAGQIGFHEGAPNPHLARHAGRLGAARRVLVPLCGKAEDLAFLAGLGHHVLGVELVEDAVRAFFSERGVEPIVSRVGAFTRYQAGSIELFAGDLFATTRELLGPVDALYDRAAVIALPEAMRRAYATHLRSLLPTGAPGIVVTLEYPQERMAGPPFSVTEEELRGLYDGCTLERVEEQAAGGNPRLAEAGAVEKCFVARF